jgi:hypothetical protein
MTSHSSHAPMEMRPDSPSHGVASRLGIFGECVPVCPPNLRTAAAVMRKYTRNHLPNAAAPNASFEMIRMTVVAVRTMRLTSFTGVVPLTISAREIIGNGSHSTPRIPNAIGRLPVIRSEGRVPLDFGTPMPNPTINAVLTGSMIIRKVRVGAPVADSSLTA